MKAPLPEGFGARPFAHRGLHDRDQGRAENSPSAIRAAIEHGYGIEVDVQLTGDHQAVVFHDYKLDRLTGREGLMRDHHLEHLKEITLLGGAEPVPTLPQVLNIVAGAAPLLIEIKDQDSIMGPNLGPLEEAVAEALGTYRGPVAVMSFNPHAVALMAKLCPDIARGLTTGAFSSEDWPHLPPETRDRMRAIPDYAPTSSVFISHQVSDLNRPRVAALKSQGAEIYCWTVKSEAEEHLARRVADQITFEQYLPTTEPT